MKPDLRPMLATLTDKPFDDPDWIFETKWDGFRLMAEIKDGSVALYSRNLIDLSSKYPSICRALRKIRRLCRDRRGACGARRAWPLPLPAPAECRTREGAPPLLRVRPPLSRRRGLTRPPAHRAEGDAGEAPAEGPAAALQRPCVGQGHRRLQARRARWRRRRHGEACHEPLLLRRAHPRLA